MSHNEAIIYIGRLDELKSVKLLFETWAMMRNKALELVVCGSGPLDFWCRDFISKNRDVNIKLMGKVTHNQIVEYLKHARALIMCSQWYEGGPMTIVEAYSCRTPILTGRIGNIRDVTIEGKTGFTFKYNSKVSLQGAVEQIMDADTTQMGDNAYQIFQEHYSAKVNYKQLMDIYKNVLDFNS